MAPCTAQAASDPVVTIPGDLCGRLAIDSAQPLEGKWLAINKNGAGSVGPRGVLLKSRPKEDLKLVYSSRGKLIFTGKNDLGDQRMEMRPQTEPPHLPSTFNVQTPNGRIVEVDVRSLLPCAWDKMPGYKGHVDYPLPGVGEMRMTVWFNFPSQIRGFGMLHFTGSMMGNPIDVWRYVTLSRPGGKAYGIGACKPWKCKSRDAKQCHKEHEEARRRDPKICPRPD
ncbi:MAG: hypothetical protein KDE55_15870 [Novosphingobium sp.]|nr:hypothetical protein [Novosphingobium sp.]